MKTAIVFPGQGSQFVGMGKDFYDNYQIARAVYEEVNDVLNINLSKIIFDGPIEDLTLTKYTQPALMATSIAILRTLQQEFGKTIEQLCDFVAGHSLGEYTALCAAESISLADTARLLNVRGNAMQSAVPVNEGGMVAILGLSADEINKLCSSIADDNGVCQIANDNCPGQIVVSGNIEMIDQLISICQSQSVKAIKLPVSAPFHCALMKPVEEIMKNALNQVKVHYPIVSVVANVKACTDNTPENIKLNLVEQVSTMVRWHESMKFLINEEVTDIIEIGAGKVLSGLMKRIDRSVNTVSIGTISDILAFIEANLVK